MLVLTGLRNIYKHKQDEGIALIFAKSRLDVSSHCHSTSFSSSLGLIYLSADHMCDCLLIYHLHITNSNPKMCCQPHICR